MTTDPKRGRSIEQTNADYAAMTKDDPKAAELYQELQNDVVRRAPDDAPDPYTYPAGSARDENRMSDEVSDCRSNVVMRKFLREVEEKCCKSRQDDYGTPPINHGRTAAIAAVVLREEITAEEVCIINLSQKFARCAEKLTYDSLQDLAGYAANLAAVMDARLPVNGT